MSFRRYIAANSRDALAQARRELGEDAVILSNRRVPEGFEIVAAGARAMERIVQEAPARRVSAANAAVSAATPARTASAASGKVAAPVAASVAAPRPLVGKPDIRPDESFQEFVRRQTQAKQQATKVSAPVSEPVLQPAPEPVVVPSVQAQVQAEVEPVIESTPQPSVAARYREVGQMNEAPPVDETEDEAWAPTTFHMPLSAALSTPIATHTATHGASHRVPARWASGAGVASANADEMRRLAASPAVFRRGPHTASSLPFATVEPIVPSAAKAAAAEQAQVLEELSAMRNQLQQQLDRLSSTVAENRAQLHQELSQSLAQISVHNRLTEKTLGVRVMSRLLTAGFSPELARKLALHVPADLGEQEMEAWLQEVIALNLKVVADRESMVETGGVFALLGPTGVGKTTTVAKLAARFAVKYGSGALGLITLDAYRVGAHDQLRAYGRILGAPVHLAQDSATLHELLVSMQNKRLVLIDTCGVSQRDDRLNEVLALMSRASEGVPEVMRIERVLLIHAASHAETLEEAARAWRARECVGCVFTKLDEAARIGGALDTALRYKLRLLGVTNGQRVPEDWHSAHARVLAHLALRPGADNFALDNDEALIVASDRPLARSTPDSFNPA